MARLFKALLVILAGVVGIFVIAAVALFLFFDPNDFRDRISVAVKEQTGRDLVIEGELSLTVFPWLAVEMGPTQLGNAEGFSGDQFLTFEQASLSVRLMPLIFQQQVKVGTALLDGLVVNLEVASDGTTNWDDLAEGGDSAAGADSGDAAEFDVANINLNNASVTYTDAQAGSSYAISELSFETGRIVANTPIDMSAEFDFNSSPGELGGHLAIRGTASMNDGASQISVDGLNISGALRGIVSEPTEFNFDSRAINVDVEASSINLGELDLTVLGLSMSADVAPFSYAGTPQPKADLRVAEFSLKELMEVLDIAPPVTADPSALQRVSFSASAAVGETALALSSMTLELDQSVMTGSLSVPMTTDGALQFDLAVDSIALDAYMAPTDDSMVTGDDEETGDIEIPVDLIRTLNANGRFKIGRAFLSGMEFENLELGLNSSGGRLRLHPLAADFYDGSYSGDVRIDASGDVPSVSANENISDVNLATLAKAMFDQENITGTINGGFVLGGSGQNLSAIRRDLDGSMSIELIDGAWEGTDVWHELRRARAMFRQEPVPEPVLPAKTEFSTVTATGVVTKVIFENDDFLAELPFLQLTGRGMVDLTSTEVDYSLNVRVLDRPEFMTGATPEELDDFTETVVPLKITGLMSSLSVKPDIEGIFRGRVEEAIEEKTEELKKDLLNRLIGGSVEPEPVEGEVPPQQLEGEEVPEALPEEETEEDLEEKLKKELLKKIFER
jgi:AsmA protein